MKEWDSISKEAKSLITNLLVKDPKKRYTAKEALEHPWFQMEPEQNPRPLDTQIMERLKNYKSKSKFYNEALNALVKFCDDKIIEPL